MFERYKKYQFDPYSWKIHLLFWVVSIFSWFFFVLIFDGEWWEPLVNKLCYLPSQMIIVYAFLYILLPLIFDKQYLSFLGLLILLGYVTAVLARLTKIYIYEPAVGYILPQETFLEVIMETSHLLVQYMIWVFFLPILTIMMILILRHFTQKAKIEMMRKEKNKAELNFLKAQLHPHFLFNTLNNLYALSIVKSPKTSDIAGKLNDIIDYMFHKCDTQSIAISEEIQLINNYIELEKIRYGDRLQISFEQNVDQSHFKIVPLMLLSLIENAFKHGASKDPENPIIKIKIKLENERLQCHIFNTVAKNEGTDLSKKNNGIGIQNVRRQLEILYPKNSVFHIKDEAKQFEVYLEIPELQERKLAVTQAQPAL